MSAIRTDGLTAAEAAERVARGQVNRLARSGAAAYAGIVARNLFTLFNLLIVPAAAALFALDDRRAAVAVSGMALTNLVLGLVQEVRAKRHLDQLMLLAETGVRVRRDGQVCLLPAGDVVQDDLLLLAAGEAIVADGRVLEAHFLEVDESLLTGESVPLTRRAGDPLLSGSFCVAGEGLYRAEKVGADAYAQRLAGAARTYHYQPSPLQVSINRLLSLLTGTAIVLCCVYVGLTLAGSLPLRSMVAMTAATVTSMIPQGLILMTTLAFVLGAVRLSRRGALVQRLNAVEAMAGIDTLCLDKTGTLTTNRLRLERLQVLANDLDEEEVRARARLFASLSLDRGSKNLAALRAALGESPGELLDQLPFKAQNRYSAVRVRAGGADLVLALGAWEALRPFLDETAGSQGERQWQEMTASGLRLLLLAEGRPRNGSEPPAFAGSLAEFVLRPLALVALRDELRPEARGILEELARQGMEVRVLSGDDPETVRATVAALATGSNVQAFRALAEALPASGADLEKAADPDELIRRHRIFGRVAPQQKVQILQALQRQGRRVAMVGDGVNDVLAIKHADLGISLGEGSSASKRVAALVLEDNRFDALPETLQEGRTILRNLRRAGKLFLVKNAYTLLLIVVAVGVFSLPFPYLPQQVTLLNFLTIGIPGLLITCSRSRAGPTGATGFLAEVGGFALSYGAVLGMAALALQLEAAWSWHAGARLQRTLLLSELILLGLAILVRILSDGRSGPSASERMVYGLAVAGGPLYLLVMYCPLLAAFFDLAPLDGSQWLWVVGVAGAALAVLWGAAALRGRS